MIFIPDALDELRREQNLSLRELSRRAGVSLPTVQAVLKGRGATLSVVKVANALNYAIRWTFRDAEDGKRRLLLLAGNLQTQAGMWRRKFTQADPESLAAPGLSQATIERIERGESCHFATLERFGRLIGLEFTLTRGGLANTLDLGITGQENHASSA